MPPQLFSWTCSVCSITWVLNATNNPTIERLEVGNAMGYPECINETYGCMSTDCVVDTLEGYGFNVKSKYVTFDEAYAICRDFTGTINPQGMYHFMGIRGIQGNAIWVANSAEGYKGVYDLLDRDSFNMLGPVEVVYLESYK
jgi:hypothetical protein